MRIVVLGDSLAAGFGLAADQAYPVRLAAALRARGHDVRVDNAGVSGDTSTAGLARLEWAVPDGTHAVIVELGANDALRGVPLAVTREALDTIIRRLKARKIEVLLAGMRAPPNLGADYAAAFDAIYPELARTHEVALIPFFLEGVAADPKLNLSDGMHPNAAGVAAIVERTLPAVEALIARVNNRKAS
jgi:acyl-CoA thioesterase-1